MKEKPLRIFTKIKGLSDKTRLPRLGTIRLGLKVRNSKGVEYPQETDYFVCPEKVVKKYGAKPTELEVMIPSNNIEEIFPMSYKFYGASRGLKCQGNGEVAVRVNDESKEMEEIPCPCSLLDDGKCKQTANLMVMIPKVSVGGVYQIRTSSYNSIIDIQSYLLNWLTPLIGRFSMIPLKLKRVKTETHHEDKKQTHYTLQLELDADIATINLLRTDTLRVLEHQRFSLPAPVDENPELEPVDIELKEEDFTVVDSTVEDFQQSTGMSEGEIKKFMGVEEPTQDSPRNTDRLITPKQKSLLEARLRIGEVKKETFLDNFQISKLELLPFEKMNEALEWVAFFSQGGRS